AEAGEARAADALRLFCRLYGAVAGNVALTFWATGGVYIAGGIAPRILSRLEEGAFLDAFLDKGRFRASLARMPVRVVLEPRVGLLGAMRVAARLVSPRSST
ncbi:MAG: glucokinase, partial [Burkholderiales bacterium]